AAAYERADVLVSPSTPFAAFPLGERVDDPMAMYLNDLCTLPASLSGTPAISVPCGLSTEYDSAPAARGASPTLLPVGLQIMAPPLADDRCSRVAAAVEAAQDARRGRPFLSDAPPL